MIQLNTNNYKTCSKCEAEIALSSKFCSHCGSLEIQESIEDHFYKWPAIKQLALFYGIEIIICCFSNLSDTIKTIPILLVVDCIFAVLGIIFFSRNWNDSKTLLIWHNFSFKKLLFYCLIAFSASIIVQYSVNWLNNSLFNEKVYYYIFFIHNRYGIILMVLFIAIIPALFEELAYRGFVLQSLLKVVDKRQAIFVSAFMFAAIHISILSLFWLIPFAMLLAIVRIK